MRKGWFPEIRTWFKPWLLAWAIAVFVSSALLAVLDPLEQISFLARMWAIADEMSPLAKLMFGGALALIFAAIGRIERRLGRFSQLAFVCAAGLVPALVMTGIPIDYSRGFGMGYSGRLFAPMELACWMTGCVLGGMFYAHARQ